MGVNTVSVMHVIAVIRDLGLAIPDQIGICGSDDWGQSNRINWLLIVSLGITTFIVQAYEIGRAARILLEQIQNPGQSKQEICLSSQLVIRNSTMLKKRIVFNDDR